MDPITERYYRADQIKLATAIIDISRIINYAGRAATLALIALAYYHFGHLSLFLVLIVMVAGSIWLTGWAWLALPSDLDELLTTARDIEIAQRQENWRIP